MEPRSTNCPHIPLTDLRQKELRQFIDSILSFDRGRTNAEVYESVLLEFGEGVCRADLTCPHYKSAVPEYQHIVRLVLDDGKRQKDYTNVRRGLWVLTA